MRLDDALTIEPLNRCSVIAGKKGLWRNVTSINSYDAPDVVQWLKPGELVLTTGYVFKNDENFQIDLIVELATRKCAGLGIKTDYYPGNFPKSMLEKADELDMPLIEIPDHLFLSDIILAFLRELFKLQDLKDEQSRKKSFFTKLLHGDLRARDAIFSQGQPFGLIPGKHVCMCAYIHPDGRKPETDHVTDLIAAVSDDASDSLISTELNDIVMIHQAPENCGEKQVYAGALRAAQLIVEKVAEQLPHLRMSIGIGTCRGDILKIGESFTEARKALQLGEQLQRNAGRHHIYDYRSLESYAILEHVPEAMLSSYFMNRLNDIIQHDRVNNSDLLKTLDVYLHCFGRMSDTARRLGVHRNTVHFRISRIKELLDFDLENGEHLFQLQLALHISHLLDNDDGNS